MAYNNVNPVFHISRPLRAGVKLWLLLFALFLTALCFLVSCSGEEDAVPAGGVPVGFTLPGIGTEVSAGASTRATLPDGAKVRVVVYKAGGQSSAHYVTEKMYTVQSGGALSPEDGQPLYLIDGTYDFYAITPGLSVTHSGDHPTVSVGHTSEYAVSLTSGKQVSKGMEQNSVSLSALERKCAYTGFEAWLIDYISYVKTLDISEVTLTAMRRSPETVAIGSDFSASATNDYTLTGGTPFFTRKVGDDRRSVGGFAVLPKTDGVFNLGMKVCFNGASTPVAFSAQQIQSLSFVKGYKYTFTVKLTKGGPIALELTVSQWNDVAWDEELGGNPSVTVRLGEWTDVTWAEDLGGNPTTLVSVGGWSSFDWHEELGGNPVTNVDGSLWQGEQWMQEIGGNFVTTVGIPVWTTYEDKPVLGE